MKPVKGYPLSYYRVIYDPSGYNKFKAIEWNGDLIFGGNWVTAFGIGSSNDPDEVYENIRKHLFPHKY